MTFQPASCCLASGCGDFGQRVLQRRDHLLIVGFLAGVHDVGREHHIAGIGRLLRRRSAPTRAARTPAEENRASQQDSGQSSHLQASSKRPLILTYRRADENSHDFVGKKHPCPRQARWRRHHRSTAPGPRTGAGPPHTAPRRQRRSALRIASQVDTLGQAEPREERLLEALLSVRTRRSRTLADLPAATRAM